ncbi:MAG: hypothetical protein V4689_05585 [Verrucomicrobiota bacterium]
MNPIHPYRFARFPLNLLLGCMVWLGFACATFAEVVLSGFVGLRIINDDVVIARNTSCVLNSSVINGKVRLGPGASLLTVRSQITGNVRALHSSRLDLRIFTRVEGDVLGEGARAILMQSGTIVAGNVELADSNTPSGADALLIVDSTVTGRVLATNNSGLLRIGGCGINGNIAFLDNGNGSYLIRNNFIRGNVRYIGNRGAGVIVINRVEGNLLNRENSPPPSIANNIVGGNTVIR